MTYEYSIQVNWFTVACAALASGVLDGVWQRFKVARLRKKLNEAEERLVAQTQRGDTFNEISDQMIKALSCKDDEIPQPHVFNFHVDDTVDAEQIILAAERTVAMHRENRTYTKKRRQFYEGLTSVCEAYRQHRMTSTRFEDEDSEKSND
jgi:hypothetical protein